MTLPPPPDTIRLKTKFADEDARLMWSRYVDNGRAALYLTSPRGHPLLTATVNLSEVGLAEGETLIKNYADGAGVLDCLVGAGIVAHTGREVASGYVRIPVCRWLVAIPEEALG